jgi:hypothetical protein
VPGCILALVMIKMIIQFTVGNAIYPVKPVNKTLFAGYGRQAVNLGAVAGAQYGDFFHPR